MHITFYQEDSRVGGISVPQRDLNTWTTEVIKEITRRKRRGDTVTRILVEMDHGSEQADVLQLAQMLREQCQEISIEPILVRTLADRVMDYSLHNLQKQFQALPASENSPEYNPEEEWKDGITMAQYYAAIRAEFQRRQRANGE